MNIIRVLIDNTEVSVYKIEDTGLAITWQAKLIGEINSYSTATTKTLTLPLTKEINVLLNSPAVLDSTKALSQREKHSIDVYLNEAVSLRGWIKLIRVVILDNDKYIECSVEPREKTWIEEFKKFKLTDLDFTISPDQSHALTYSNIVTSETYSSSREYVYAPIDISEIGRLQVLWVEQSGGNTDFYYIGKQVVAATNTFVATTYGFKEAGLNAVDTTLTETADTFWNSRGIYKARSSTILMTVYKDQWGYMWVRSVDYWQVGDFYPSIRHKDIIRRCYQRAGYSCTLIESDEYLDDKYNFIHDIKTQNDVESRMTNHIKFKTRVPNGGYTIPAQNPLAVRYYMPFINYGGYGYLDNTNYTDTDSDVSANFLAGTNISKYTFAETEIVRFEWNYEFKTTSNGVVQMDVYLYDSGGVARRLLYQQVLTFTTTETYFSGKISTSNIYGIAGDYVQCEIAIITNADLIVYDSNSFESFPYEGGNFKGKTIRLNHFLPDRTAYEYMKDLTLINNLEFYTDEILKMVYVVPDDLKRSGKKFDFSNKLVRGKEIELEEVGALHPKKIYFNWKKDKDDWCVKLVELVTESSLITFYKGEELEYASRFGAGIITNTNTFEIDVTQHINDIYAASLDKYDSGNRINFNTVEMKGESTWAHPPSWKRVDYEPRYLRIIFAETLESNGVGGATGVIYKIEDNINHGTYPRVEFQLPLHFEGSTGLLATKYLKTKRRIQYGLIVRGYFDVDEGDVNGFANVVDANSDFRGDYLIKLDGVEAEGELLKVIDYNPAIAEQTQIEFIIFRDDI